MAVSPLAVAEDGATNLDYTFTRNGNLTNPLTVNFSVSGTADFATDYTQSGADTFSATSGTVTFAANSSTAVVTVDPTTDAVYENDESVILTVTSGAGYNPSAPTTATGTITNDDAQPSFSIDDVTMNEGDSGTTSFTFTVTKTGATALGSSVNFQTMDGTATLADNDYQTNSGTLTFGPTDTTMQVTVMVNGDTTVEPNETFTVHLSGEVNATISDADGTGTITNDDVAPSFSINDVTQAETNSGQTAFVFTVTKTGNSGASVDFETQDGTATAPSDYATNNGTLTFGPTDTTMQVTVMVDGDTTPEPDETFTVHLLNASVGASRSATLTVSARSRMTMDHHRSFTWMTTGLQYQSDKIRMEPGQQRAWASTRSPRSAAV